MFVYVRFKRIASATRIWFRRLRYRLTPDSRLAPIEKFARDGYSSLLVEGMNLGPQSKVMDFGGYLGEWCGAIVKQYGCRVDVFEPVADFAESLELRFRGDSRVRVWKFAIGASQGPRRFGLTADGTGMHANGNGVTVMFRSPEILYELENHRVDLVAINIEGGEYELIPTLASSKYLDVIHAVLIQFHQVGDDFEAEREKCRNLLRKNYRQVWNYDYVWEYWVRLGDLDEDGTAAP